jgi:hypothetical protein
VAETARYLYAITRRLDPASLSDTPGLGGSALEVVEHRELAAVVSDVALDEYGEAGLRRNLERLDWLEETARTHDTVVKVVSAMGPTAPLRLATICLDDDGVRRRMDEWYTALQQVLDRIEGRLELSVKVFAPHSDQAAPVQGASESAPGSGAEYLRRKKAATEARRTSEALALEACESIHEGLAKVAVAGRRLPAQDPRLTGHAGTMLLNGAYLVERDEVPVFERTVNELADRFPDLAVDVRGPWPPYSFAMLEQR